MTRNEPGGLMKPARLWPNSLSGRLFITGALVASVVLSLSALILTQAYRSSAESAFDDRLDVYTKILTGAFASQILDDGEIGDPGNTGEQRFRQPLSGWYWVVRDRSDGRFLAASDSLTGETLDLPPDMPFEVDAAGLKKGYLTGPDGRYLRIVERDILVGESALSIAVSGDAGSLQAGIAAFQWTVLVTQTVFGVALVLLIIFQVRFGLRPLSAISRGLTRIRNGESRRLDGTFPTEIEPLVTEMNALIQSNQDVIDRARTQVGNLAHALKTPLSVITNEADKTPSPFAEKVREQAVLMRTQVQVYLDRARMAAQSRGSITSTPVRPVVERLVRVMLKLYAHRETGADVDIPDTLRFSGERQDLEEVLGNIIDNAFKYGARHVTVRARLPENGIANGLMTMEIDDDGPGIPLADREKALGRGRRLDETSAGSGLGLHIVSEIAELYGGSLSLDDTPGGGLRVRLRLPATESPPE